MPKPILQILTMDFKSKACLKGAYYQLNAYNGCELHAVSDTCGNAKFVNLSPGNYTLVQFTPSPGYQPHPLCWRIQVDCSGYIWIDSVEQSRLNVYNHSNLLDGSKEMQLLPIITQPDTP